ncbi:DEAD/DEAH box helicase [Candidatus Purcelliella pentastirinorum]|uniref:DEAD/DEAH box helicase n=1 Tax=Candidatus Purcelliella pentastirinorum TaxID=472834 RepID=UPI002368EE57|nr:DEAD/DEAH box helicase [Candidatus Purcelliella pentastirinorum]WDI78931.1 DEAD/DEAH box helicase [Candidatus Purcelliella pentastirinorum]WDR80066.1 DEAD/DEAH box helicase [Candidatus Purcelliella pentastirinorum]
MNKTKLTFNDLKLNSNIIKALKDIGYIKPSPIQIACIPELIKGRDVLGIAQTGSGKTAAFALPFLNNININKKNIQILVLTPTRELAKQITNSYIKFAKYINNIKIISIYGGQKYETQLYLLRNKPQIIIGTPGRLLDHLKRKTINLSKIKKIIIDEADEMLKMGFIEDVEKIISKIKKKYQIALFSATMPNNIRNITYKFTKNPIEIKIKSNIQNIPDINQNYCLIYGRKNEALSRFLEIEKYEAVLIFVRTKNSTLKMTSFLEKKGYTCSPLNGDMNQISRERTLEKFKQGPLNILIATDIAARGLDVERINLVINYDIPLDPKSYIHRIGRTGRAGRKGKSLLFVENKERYLLKNIKKIIKLPLKKIELPKPELLNLHRQNKFIDKIQKQLKNKNLEKYRILLIKLQKEKEIDIETLATILLKLAQKEKPLLLPPDNIKYKKINKIYNKPKTNSMCLYTINLGIKDGIKIKQILNELNNKNNIRNNDIGKIKIFKSYSTIELSKRTRKKIEKNKNKIKIMNKITLIRLSRKRYIKKKRQIIN